MATIPNVYRERVTPQPSMDVARHESGIFGRALQQVGRNVSQIGGVLQKEQQRIDDARSDEAINRLRQKQLDLSVGQPEPGKDTQGGYANLRGAAWVTPDATGMVPMDRYRQGFTSGQEAIAKELGLSGRALDRYNAFAANANLDFQSGLMRHALKESDSYYAQTFDNTVKSEAQNAGANWNNPGAVVESLRRVSEATQREAERIGGVDVVASQQEALAGVHSSVIEGALREGDAKFAEEYLNSYKGTLPAKTALTLNNMVQSVRTQQIAISATDKVMRGIAHRVMPSPYDRAAGLAQATPGVVPFKEAVQQSGGDTEKAWAIYHSGKKTVAEAEVQAMKSERENKKDPTVPIKRWQEFLPEKTRAYVEDTNKAYAAGGGVTPPTLAEVKELTRRQVLADSPKATGEQIESAMTKAEQHFNDLRATQRQTQENTLLDVQRRVDAGKIRSRHDLTPQDMALLGDQAHAAVSYINGAQANEDKMAQASPAVRETVDRFKASPAVLAGTDVATIMSLGPEIGNANVNDLLKRRDEYINNPEKFTSAKIDADAFEVAIAPFVKGVSKGEAALFKHKVRAKVEEELARRRASGETGLAIQKDMTSTINKFAMSYPVEKPGFFFGTNTEQVPGVDLPNVEQPLPPAEAAKIDKAWAKLGGTNLSDSDRLRIYRKMKAAEAAK